MADFICLAVASQYPEHLTTSSVEPSTPTTTTSSSSFRRSLNAATILGRRLSRSSESAHPHETSNNSNVTATTTTNTTNSSVSMHVRIVPSIDNPRRSLIFDIVDRELKGGSVVKIGRFTDRSVTTNHVSFKSKVVSRTHCEIWVDAEDGKLYVRDTKSSSGTFVNHGRLSAANQESRPVEVHDGDIVQLGVDYQGGVEEMYRAVKMRFELNRRPQPLIHSSALTHIVKKEEDHGHSSSGGAVDECCICLYAMAPFQALFIAPCCHSYHFKCIRPLLESYPGFQCPLCRTYSDLEASVEEPATPVTEDQPQQQQLQHHHQQQEEEEEQQQQQVIAATSTPHDDIQVEDQRESGDLHHHHHHHHQSEQQQQPLQTEQHHREEHEQSSFHHHNQTDPLDTTLVLSPSNLSGILSNPSSPSGTGKIMNNMPVQWIQPPPPPHQTHGETQNNINDATRLQTLSIS
ncbi:hypothetical protein BDB00DRAFT_784210 [Zychaea mexicana]|uniref:uncharacterized protein n=1 Tax=Zychaea mexicana TaxID=64656 RepID=UPI0022FEE43D|nr:uncharacterized protein BDB00DRAFT_784210 [Zychaea mexicana]KAI9498134.1 hypothetical protein BDB00DRAFT_784210 [Zychaea mexicana]